MQDIKLLDCTIRDGGYALEGIMESRNGAGWDNESASEIIRDIVKAKIDIIELGRMDYPHSMNGERSGEYDSIESVSSFIPEDRTKEQLFSVLFRGPDIPLELIPDWRKGLCEIIRVCIRYSEIDKSLDYASKLCQKGYKVSIQCSVTMRFKESEIKKVLTRANEMKAWAVYIVDTYGYMETDDVDKLYKIYDSILEKEIRIGFHSHNNLDNASRNAKYFLTIVGERAVIIDSCCLGMGQSAGNLQTEIISYYLNNNYDKEYDYLSIIKACDIVNDKFWKDNIWGYSLKNVIAANYRIAYGYSIVLREKYKKSYYEIAQILANVPDDMKYRYTNDNLIKLLEKEKI